MILQILDVNFNLMFKLFELFITDKIQVFANVLHSYKLKETDGCE